MFIVEDDLIEVPFSVRVGLCQVSDVLVCVLERLLQLISCACELLRAGESELVVALNLGAARAF